MDVAQNFFEDIVSKALKIPREILLVDGRPPGDPDQSIHAVYVDNCVVCASDKTKCVESVDAIELECRHRGLPTHGAFKGVAEAEVLGWTMDGKRK